MGNIQKRNRRLPYPGINIDIKPDRFSCTDGTRLWKIASPDSLVRNIDHVGAWLKEDPITGTGLSRH